MDSKTLNIDALRQLYRESPVAKAFFDHAARRERDLSVTKVSRILSRLKEDGHEFRRRDIIELFRKMEQQGLGQFVEGRHGWPSRFVWSTGLTSVGRAAAGEPQVIEYISGEEDLRDAVDTLLDQGDDEEVDEPSDGAQPGDTPEAVGTAASSSMPPGSDSGEPEGLDTAYSTGWGGEYPLDAVFVRTDQRTVAEVVRRIRQKRYDLNPDFQRDFIWSNHKQSRLIESCLMRIPLPVFYVAEAQDGRIIIAGLCTAKPALRTG